MRYLAILVPALAIAGCAKVPGDYGGPDCPYQKLTLKSDGTAYLTMYGSEISAPYKVDGDKVSILIQGTGIVFTKKGDTLEAGTLMGQKMACKKL